MIICFLFTCFIHQTYRVPWRWISICAVVKLPLRCSQILTVNSSSEEMITSNNNLKNNVIFRSADKATVHTGLHLWHYFSRACPANSATLRCQRVRGSHADQIKSILWAFARVWVCMKPGIHTVQSHSHRQATVSLGLWWFLSVSLSLSPSNHSSFPSFCLCLSVLSEA